MHLTRIKAQISAVLISVCILARLVVFPVLTVNFASATLIVVIRKCVPKKMNTMQLKCEDILEYEAVTEK